MKTALPLLVILILTSACGAGRETPRETTVAPYTDPSAAVLEARAEAASTLGRNGELRRAVWDKKADAAEWTLVVLQELHVYRQYFENAQDIEDFCPKYAQATNFQKNTCWLRLLSAMARYESNFDPEATYRERSGQNSVGFLMMNPDHCPSANTELKLKNAEANIKCAIPRLSKLIVQDQYISGPDFTGGAAYWSVLRSPYQRGKLFLGRRPQIQEFTRSYMAFRER